jgi:hypothetical protein
VNGTFYSVDQFRTFLYIRKEWIEVDNRLNTIEVRGNNLGAAHLWMAANGVKNHAIHPFSSYFNLPEKKIDWIAELKKLRN